MTRSLRIDVQQGNIRDGVPNDCQSCPVALAMKQHGIEQPYVGSEFIRWGAERQHWMKTPKVVKRLVRDFDLRKHVDPISFELVWTP